MEGAVFGRPLPCLRFWPDLLCGGQQSAFRGGRKAL